MPSIANLINDLADASIVGIGAKPPSNEESKFGTVSSECRIEYSSVHMKAEITPSNRLSCQSALNSPDFNGNYLHFKDGTITIAEMDEKHPIVASGNFSGCTYKVFKTGDGTALKAGDKIICAHIARPSGPDANELVALMDKYAKQNKWIQLQEIKTAGYIEVNNCSELFIVSRLKDENIESIMLKLDRTGSSIGVTNRVRTAV